MSFICQSTLQFKYTFAVAWLIPKENSSYCVLSFHLVWNTSRHERLYVCLFVFMVLFCSSFRSRSEQPRPTLIRWCLMWESLTIMVLAFTKSTYNIQFFILYFKGTTCSLIFFANHKFWNTYLPSECTVQLKLQSSWSTLQPICMQSGFLPAKWVYNLKIILNQYIL